MPDSTARSQPTRHSTLSTQHLVLVRRFLVVAALMFWQGGFTFYAAIVVPIGTAALGSALEQGRITRQVTESLNLSGAVALAIFALDTSATPSLRWSRWTTWLIMALALGVLFTLHARLDALFLPDDLKILDRPTFRLLHRTYLWVSTVQWAAAIGFAVLSLAAWRGQGEKLSESVGPGQCPS